MKKYLLVVALLIPVLAHGDGVVLSPAPALWVNPANPWSYGISIGPGYSGVSEYPIDLNNDGVVDYTLTSKYREQTFCILPSGSNAVLSYVIDSFGSSFVANLDEGTQIGPLSSLLPIWQTTTGAGNSPQFITSGFTADGVDGLFADTSGYIGLEMYVNGEVHYGFLQIDCRGYSGGGGFYEGYGYNTLAGQPIITQSVPEPSGVALLGLGLAIGCLTCMKQKERASAE
jgi:hypothetical protein